MKKVEYLDLLQLIPLGLFFLRLFPLPYRQNAFIVAKSAQLVSVYGTSSESVFTFMDSAFAQQPTIYNSATMDLIYNQIVDLIGSGWLAGTGVSENAYTVAMNSSSPIEMETRYQFKFSALLSVFATPFFAINGLQIAGLESLEDWVATLDALLNV